MGFSDFLKEAGQKAYDYAYEKTEQYNGYLEKYYRASDNELVRTVKLLKSGNRHFNPQELTALKKVCRERGIID